MIHPVSNIGEKLMKKMLFAVVFVLVLSFGLEVVTAVQVDHVEVEPQRMVTWTMELDKGDKVTGVNVNTWRE